MRNPIINILAVVGVCCGVATFASADQIIKKQIGVSASVPPKLEASMNPALVSLAGYDNSAGYVTPPALLLFEANNWPVNVTFSLVSEQNGSNPAGLSYQVTVDSVVPPAAAGGGWLGRDGFAGYTLTRTAPAQYACRIYGRLTASKPAGYRATWRATVSDSHGDSKQFAFTVE